MSCVANKVLTEKKASLAVLSAWLVLLVQLPVFAVQDAVVSWNASGDTKVAGYKIYYGSSSRAYTNVVDVGNATNVTISGLAEGSTNYFAATTYAAEASESPYSEEVVCVTQSSTPITITNPPIVITNLPADGANTNISTPPSLPPVLNVVGNVTVATNVNDSHSVVVSWDASTDLGVTGYQVCMGLSSGNFPKFINVGLVNSLVVTGLVAGTTNYFTVNEFDASWTKSTASAEAVWYLPVPANRLPTLDAITNRSINMNSGVQTIALTGITSGSPEEHQTLKVKATSATGKLVSNISLNYSSPKTNGILTFKPISNATGTDTITVTVNDGGTGSNSFTRTFIVTVVNPAILAAMPKITKQIRNIGALPGKTVSFGVTVSGKAPFKYQWKYNGKNLAGATAATLTLKGLKASHAGAYSVLVSNNAGSTNSVTAQLTVYTNTAPTISTPAKTINGQFGFQVDGVPGAKYVVQASTNLKTWTSIRTNIAPFTFTDSNSASFSQRYYRSFYQP